MVNSKLQLILASASPRRKELLGHLKLPFEIRTCDVCEESAQTDPAAFSSEIAEKKAEAVVHVLQQGDPGKNFLVVSADTIVSLGEKIYGKPQNVAQARQFLSELSGRTHSVFTAVCVKLIGPAATTGFSFVDESRVTFDEISPELLERYLATGDSLDKAGAYGIQGPSLTFISNVSGSYANVVGFPLSRFVSETEKFLNGIFPKEATWFDCFVR
ncbi:MAG TPA: Maf family protein [Bacteriovoracaceae bacterium]|nr:Maf family protein [Bacteriovoracaceae bacterium]